MARSFAVASRVYAAGSYGPFSVDSFVSADTDFLEVSFTVESWPVAAPLITGQLRWASGDGADFTINSPPKNRDGTLQTVAKVRISVPQTAGGKAAVTSASVTMQASAALRTAISLVAGTNPV